MVLPTSESEARSLRLGERLVVTGRLFTARDAAHARMDSDLRLGRPLPFFPVPSAVYHCGPLAEHTPAGWNILSAGPTSSVRLEPFAPRLVRTLGLRLLIGKGGMGEETRSALRRCGGAYAHAPGGAGALLAQAIERVEGVFWLQDLGMPEAVWVLSVRRFGPLLVTIDSHGESLYESAARRARRSRRTRVGQLEEEGR